jgi:hypothetical protein
LEFNPEVTFLILEPHSDCVNSLVFESESRDHVKLLQWPGEIGHVEYIEHSHEAELASSLVANVIAKMGE